MAEAFRSRQEKLEVAHFCTKGGERVMKKFIWMSELSDKKKYIISSLSSSEETYESSSLKLKPELSSLHKKDPGHLWLRNHSTSSALSELSHPRVQVCSSQGQPLLRAHCKTFRCPPYAATAQVHSSHGQPLLRAHCNTFRCPPLAADAQLSFFNGKPSLPSRLNSYKYPFETVIRRKLPFL